jgi:DNA-binding transcriptional MocR family regulator
LRDTVVTEAASRERVEVFPLSRFTFRPSSRSKRDALLLSYAGFERAGIRDGVRRLRRALELVDAGSYLSGPLPSPT